MKQLILSQEKIHTGSLILVNQEHCFHKSPHDCPVPIPDTAPDVLLNRIAGTLLSQLMQEIDGWRHIVPVSGWRSQEEQQRIWDDCLKENGPEFTRKFVALPGHSEHQTGLAIDLGLRQEHVDFICPEFPYTGICQTFRETAPKYGFILRYPAGKESVTGIGHEPWHFRYVGTPHAEIITKQGLCLEEYTDFLKQFAFRDKPYLFTDGKQTFLISYIKSEGKLTPLELSEHLTYTVSGNNTDGFILTEWRTQDAYQRQLRMA
ncbi:MAG: M15 family metallopeptidase [Acetatifactor sp.]|nr:M15 family metallopeptidase [Acetatifactor sp.]